MARNNNIRIDITGDTTGLQNALQQGEKALNGFGSQASGFAGNFASTMGGGLGRAGTALTGLAGVAAVAGISIAATFVKVQEAAEKSFEVFQSASLSQMGITQIQQMANMYQKVGLSMENIADQQKDIKDRLGDALTNTAGSMYTDVIQPLKLNILELQKMADAGEDVYAKIYFAAKAQGLSTSQIVNMFETMGSDATKRLTVLKDFNKEQDYQNSLSSQTIQLTDEQSSKFEKYRDATNNLSNAWDKWNYSVLAPIAGNLADILDLMTRILNSKPVEAAAVATGQQGIDAVKQYQNQYQSQMLGNSSIYGQQLVEQASKDNAELQKNLSARIEMAQANLKDINSTVELYNKGSEKSTITAAMKPFQTAKEQTQSQIDALAVTYKQTREAIQQSLYKAYKGNQSALNADLKKLDEGYQSKRDDLVKKLTEKEDKEREAKKKKDEAAAKAAAALLKKTNEERLKATEVLNKAISDMTQDSNLRQLTEFDRQQNALVESIKKSTKTLGIDPSSLLSTQGASYQTKRTDLTNSLIGYEDPNKGLKDQNTMIQGGNLSTQQKVFLTDQQNQRINGDNPFSVNNTDQKQQENTEAMNLELKQNELLLQGHEDFEKRKAEITAKYNSKAIEISNQNTQEQLEIFGQAAGDLGTGMAAAFGEGSKAAQAAFAVQKAITMAQTVLSIQSALAQALATPFPASLAAYGQVLSLGMSIISTAKGAASGQFHGGIDSVPESMHNKSFILSGSERVVQPEANKKLTAFLDNEDRRGNSNGDITINSPLIVQGNVDNTEMWNKMLKKNQNNVVQAVRSSQRRNT